MDWSAHLTAGESVLWEGRPAPRCYVFRNWKHSFYGLLLLLLSTWWQATSYPLGRLYGWDWFVWMPLPFVLLGFHFALGQLLLARLEWEHVFFALTDRRILVRRGLFRLRINALPLNDLDCFQLRPHGEHLATLRVSGCRSSRTLTLHCLEYPHCLTDRLESILVANGQEIPLKRNRNSCAGD